MPTTQLNELLPLITPHDGQYRRNFARQVVCEFRFPTLLSFGSTDPPRAFVEGLRRKYPILELGREVSLGMSDVPTTHSHQLKSSLGDWLVTVKKESFSIETPRYGRYEQFRERVVEVLNVAAPVIESDFFTRVGLRYINLVKTDGVRPLAEWINPALVGVTEAQGFNGISELAGRMRLRGDGGGCHLQHGLKPKREDASAGDDDEAQVPDYILDIDVYRDVVTVGDALRSLDEMRIQAYSLFEWALGERAREWLRAER